MLPQWPPAVVCGVRSAAPGDVEPVRHDFAVLTFPVPVPLEAMSLADPTSMYVERGTVSAPLLEPSLSFGVCSSPAAQACLRVGVLLYGMLSLPVSVCAFSAREVDRPVGPEALVASRFGGAVKPGKSAVSLVDRCEVSLPPLDFR